MNPAARAAAYLRQTGAPKMTPRQARRYRRKVYRGEPGVRRPRLDATPPASVADATP